MVSCCYGAWGVPVFCLSTIYYKLNLISAKEVFDGNKRGKREQRDSQDSVKMVIKKRQKRRKRRKRTTRRQAVLQNKA